MPFDQLKRRDFIALLAGAAVLSCALCVTATAKDAKVGGVLLKLPPPPGYCELDPSEPSDLRLFSILEGAFKNSGNRLLAISADCGAERLARTQTDVSRQLCTTSNSDCVRKLGLPGERSGSH